MNKSFYILTILALLLLSGLVLLPGASAQEAGEGPQASILFVKPGGTGDCTSWATACELQTALSAVVSDDEIWAAAGTYTPGTNRDDTFQLVSGVALYGGFTGSETAREQRDWETNITTMSGDIGVTGNNGDNSYHVVTGSDVDATAILDGFTVSGGNADGEEYPVNSGGGMFNDLSSPTLANVTFSNNSAEVRGGGMFNDLSSPTLSSVTFSSNTAVNGGGGGMWNEDSSPFLSYVTFTDNTADYGGGMHNFFSSPTLINVTFSNNSATDSGGGMYIYRGSLTLTDVTFRGNRAVSGGGMYSNWSSPKLTNVTFIDNMAIYYGGGIYNVDGSSPTLTNCAFEGNKADSGGGIYYETSSPVLTNVTFILNTAGDRGGGMYNVVSSPMLTNVTFSGNKASYGGGMLNFDSSPAITNTILWGNSAEVDGPQILNYFISSPSVSFSDIQGGCVSINGNDCSGGGNINADPLFLRNPSSGKFDFDAGDLRLRPNSPAIDAGDNTAVPTGVTTDLDGNPRFTDILGVPDSGKGTPPIVDMGAYEAMYRSLFLPLITR
jgi:hypothetical protein